MEFIEYKIKKGDTLESIAKEYNITVDELVDFHNQNCGITQQIVGNELPRYLLNIYIDQNNIILIQNDSENFNLKFHQEFKYRTEFIVGTKLEDILVDNSTYKNQYTVKLDKNRNFVYVNLDENFVSSSPALVQKGMELIADVDKVKCDSLFQISSENGKIVKILNYNEILKNWNIFKSNFNSQKSVVGLSKSQQDIHDFISKVESLMIPEENLIKDYDNKMFYEIFFNQFLVGKGDFIEKYSKTYYSTIFDQEPLTLHFTSTIIEENDDSIKVRRVSELDPSTFNLKKIIDLYDERIKPTVHYTFTEYKYSYRETFVWDKVDDILKESHITVIEEVKNNVQLLIDFKLKKIE